jgi:hypothetical protein
MVIDIDQGFEVLTVTVYELPNLDESMEKIALILSQSGSVLEKHLVGGSIGHHVDSPFGLLIERRLANIDSLGFRMETCLPCTYKRHKHALRTWRLLCRRSDSSQDEIVDNVGPKAQLARGLKG